jgi:NAD-dependent dihydropyrimidine dehydrogenase PreA subunit
VLAVHVGVISALQSHILDVQACNDKAEQTLKTEQMILSTSSYVVVVHSSISVFFTTEDSNRTAQICDTSCHDRINSRPTHQESAIFLQAVVQYLCTDCGQCMEQCGTIGMWPWIAWHCRLRNWHVCGDQTSFPFLP